MLNIGNLGETLWNFECILSKIIPIKMKILIKIPQNQI